MNILNESQLYTFIKPKKLRSELNIKGYFVEIECPKCGKKHMIKIIGFKKCNVGCFCGTIIYSQLMNLDGTGNDLWAKVPVKS